MKTKKIPIKGMSRMLPSSTSEDGLSRDMVNMRFWNGAWRPIGNYVQYATGATGGMSSYIHRVTNGDDYLITYNSTSGLIQYKPLLSGANTTLTNTIGSAKNIRFSSLHNILIIFNDTDKRIKYALFDLTENDYRYIGYNLPDILNIRIHDDGAFIDADMLDYLVVSDYADDEERESAAVTLGYKQEREINKDGFFTGYVSFIYAYELFDGSIVKHSHAQSFRTGKWNWRLDTTPEPDHVNVKLWYKKILYDVISTTDLLAIKALYNNLIKSVNIYMTRPVAAHDPIYANLTGSYLEMDEKDPFITPKEILEGSTFRLVTKLGLDELTGGSTDNVITFKDVNQAETWEALPIDNFTHHDLYAACEFKYNNRLFLGDISQYLYDGYAPQIIIEEPTQNAITPFDIFYEVDLKDVNGIKTVRSVSIAHGFYDVDTAQNIYYYLNSFFYPDSRATTLRIYLANSSDEVFLMDTKTLTSPPLANFAFWLPSELSETYVLGLPTAEAYDYDNLPSLYSTVINPNRVQATELDNPFYFPARNSYNVGHTRVVGLSANTLLVETSQFGEYPVYVFTQDGIWAMNFSAMADVLIDSIKPAALDICTNSRSITSTKYGVVFVSDDRLMIISGMRSEKLSAEMDGQYVSPLQYNVDYTDIMTDYSSALESVNFGDFLNGCVIGYCDPKSELVMSNLSYQFSRIYNLQSKSWYKVLKSYNSLLNYRTKVLGETGGILYDLTDESFSGGIDVLWESYPIKLEVDALKKIESYALRGMFECEDDSEAALYLFGSIDSVKWYNMLRMARNGSYMDLVSRRPEYSARQYIILMKAKLGEESYMTHLDFSFKDKFSNKMR